MDFQLRLKEYFFSFCLSFKQHKFSDLFLHRWTTLIAKQCIKNIVYWGCVHRYSFHLNYQTEFVTLNFELYGKFSVILLPFCHHQLGKNNRAVICSGLKMGTLKWWVRYLNSLADWHFLYLWTENYVFQLHYIETQTIIYCSRYWYSLKRVR